MGTEVKPSEIRSTLIGHGIDPDALRDFLEEQIAMMRSTDDAMKDSLGKAEFYTRETKYTRIESFIVHLK